MALEIAVADNADGTGGTATITGSAGGSVSVAAGRVASGAGLIALPTVGSRTGNGTLALSLSRGLWFAYAKEGASISSLYLFNVTDGLDAVATRVRRVVADTIRLLTISPARNVYEQIAPDDTNIVLPCVMLTTEGESESDESKLNTVDDWGRPVKVLIADRATHLDHGKLPLYETWRQAIMRCFVNQQLIGVPESKICRIEPLQIADPKIKEYGYMVAGFVVRAVTREPRGIGL